jgi:Ribose/Galactose Isomerase
MRIALGNDHAGYPLKAHVRAVLEKLGHEVVDTGARNDAPVDFPTSPGTHVISYAAVMRTAPCLSAVPVRGLSWPLTRLPASGAPSHALEFEASKRRPTMEG